MTHPSAKPLTIASLSALVVFLSLTVYGGGLAIQEPPAGTAPAPAQGQRQGRGRGGAPANPLGEGPWDFNTEQQRVHVTVVTKGLDHPWGMAFLPDGGMLVTERGGRLRVIRNGVLDPTPIGGMPQIRAVSLGGLLDIALHPRFAENRLIYFAYSKPGAEEAARATLIESDRGGQKLRMDRGYRRRASSPSTIERRGGPLAGVGPALMASERIQRRRVALADPPFASS
jgi:glucose/arabinose dehydrogenase